MDEFEGFDWAEYYSKHKEIKKSLPELPMRPCKCADCPVGDMYRPFSEGLKTLPVDSQLEASKKWFCHTNPNMACRGNADYLGLTWE